MKTWETNQRFSTIEEDQEPITERDMQPYSKTWKLNVGDMIETIDTENKRKFNGKVIGFSDAPQGRIVFIETSPNRVIWIDPYTSTIEVLTRNGVPEN